MLDNLKIMAYALQNFSAFKHPTLRTQQKLSAFGVQPRSEKQ